MAAKRSGRIGRVCWDVSPFSGELEHWKLRWYVPLCERMGGFGQFLLDLKIGLDLGDGLVGSARFAWKIWGWRNG